MNPDTLASITNGSHFRQHKVQGRRHTGDRLPESVSAQDASEMSSPRVSGGTKGGIPPLPLQVFFETKFF